MDLALSEEQEMLKKTAQDFLENKCPKALVREMEKDEKGYSPQLWHEMAELGWMGLVIPEKYGGMGMKFLDLVILIEEMGKFLLPGPFLPTVVYCGLPIAAYGTEEQKQEFLPKIAGGNIIMTLALTEPSANIEVEGIETKAAADGSDYVLNGVKLFIPDAHVADYLLVVARTKDFEDKERGITLFLVDTKSAGISCTVLNSIASDRQCEVVLENVRVPGNNILGELDKGWEIVSKVLEQGAVAQCAIMVGGAQAVLDMTVAYAKNRIQFDRPIASFQAVRHKFANMLVALESSRYITYKAAWKLSEDIPAAMEVSMAKAWVSEAYQQICAEGHDIHGGVGYIVHHDMQLYFRRAKAAELAFGDGDIHREKVAQRMGL
jgi:alkylation response protein AidB-like acyl-CoA dehydrogenase